MPIIRNAQMEVFRGAALRAFEDEMVVHLSKFSAPLYNAVKAEQMRRAIRLGMKRADGYGLNLRGLVRL